MKIDFQSLGGIYEFRSGEHWTAAKLQEEVARRVGFLTQHAIGRGQIVAISHGGTPAFFADLFALWSVGACAACLNPKLTPSELSNIVSFTKATAVLVSDLFDTPQTGIQVPIICSHQSGLEEVAKQAPQEPSSHLDDPALILFTSGTTGTPKGVVHSFRGILARLALNQVHIGEDKLKRTLCTLPTHFGHGLIGNCLTPLFSGGDLYLFQEMNFKEMSKLGELLSDNQITFMSSVPAFWKMALKVSPPPNKQTLQQVHIGSAPLSSELWQAVQSWSGTPSVHNLYGITETANWIAGASAQTYAPDDGLIGKMWGGRAVVIDTQGNMKTEGEGELAVQTPALMQGYLNQEELTNEVLSQGWFRTGDAAHIDFNGVIRLTGRLKSEINKAGMKIHPEELDLLLERHAEVQEACAFGVPDEISGELVGVAIHLTPDATADKTQLRAWCSERIKKDSIPDRWFFVEAIPKTDRGKINRDLVRRHCMGDEK